MFNDFQRFLRPMFIEILAPHAFPLAFASQLRQLLRAEVPLQHLLRVLTQLRRRLSVGRLRERELQRRGHQLRRGPVASKEKTLRKSN